MNQKEALELVEQLYECSKKMMDLSKPSADVLLEMASALLDKIEKTRLPENIREEIEDIKKELLDE